MTKRNPRALFALGFVCIAWGTTYLALRIGVQHFPAFLFAAIRQVVAGSIIMLIAWLLNRRTDLSMNNLKHQAVIGFLLITIGNGLVTWAERVVPSGIAALICSLTPICVVVINLMQAKSERVNSTIIFGMLLGIAGIGLIFKDNLADISNKAYLVGMISIFLATCTWSWGSILSRKKTGHEINPLYNAGLQLLSGGIFLFAGSPLMDDYSGEINLFHPEVLWSMVYLIIIGSVLAYSAYMYAFKKLPVGIASLYAYINPMVAVVLGYLILQEQLTWFTVLAFITIIAGVYLVKYGYKQQGHQS
jgi:drug/metabolite transporter (DMT)-like permease